MKPNVHIIGAGVSGLAAAVRLSNSGFTVHVHEATPQAGGRCRSFYDAATDLTIEYQSPDLVRTKYRYLAARD